MVLPTWFKQREVKWGLWGLGAVLMIYLAIGSWLSKIEISKDKMNLAWTTLQQNCNARSQLLPRFSQLLQTNAVNSATVWAQLNQAYQQASSYKVPKEIWQDQIAVQQFLATQNAVVAALIQMLTSQANVPAIAENRQYGLMKNELQKIEQQIQFAEEALQRETQFYNYYITGFPHGWANAVSLRYSPAIVFEVPTLEKTIQPKRTSKAS